MSRTPARITWALDIQSGKLVKADRAEHRPGKGRYLLWAWKYLRVHHPHATPDDTDPGKESRPPNVVYWTPRCILSTTQLAQPLG